MIVLYYTRGKKVVGLDNCGIMIESKKKKKKKDYVVVAILVN